MARKKKIELPQPKIPKWDFDLIDELQAAIEDVEAIMRDIQRKDFYAWEWLRYGEDPEKPQDYGLSYDLLNTTDWALLTIDSIKSTYEKALYLTNYFPTDKAITINDIDDDLKKEMNKIFGGTLPNHTGVGHYTVNIGLEDVVDFFNTHFVRGK